MHKLFSSPLRLKISTYSLTALYPNDAIWIRPYGLLLIAQQFLGDALRLQVT